MRGFERHPGAPPLLVREKVKKGSYTGSSLIPVLYMRVDGDTWRGGEGGTRLAHIARYGGEALTAWLRLALGRMNRRATKRPKYPTCRSCSNTQDPSIELLLQKTFMHLRLNKRNQ